MSAAIPVLIGYGILTALAFTASAFLCGGDELETDSGNVFTQIGNFLMFQSCSDIPAWASGIMFLTFVFPWIIFAIYLLLPAIGGLLANPIVGSIVGIAFVGIIVGVFVAYVT